MLIFFSERDLINESIGYALAVIAFQHMHRSCKSCDILLILSRQITQLDRIVCRWFRPDAISISGIHSAG